jgi:cytochrome c-type biogenesis protein
LLVAFAAGLASFLSPCVLPLVPVYLGYLGGSAAASVPVAPGAGQASAVTTPLDAPRAVLARSALGFVVGFGLVFVALGVALGLLGRSLAGEQQLLARLGGVLIIAFALMLLGALRPPWGERELRLPLEPRPGLWGSLLFGAVFGFAWTPCIGPTLGAILTLALTSGGSGRAAVLLGAYAAGLAVPFLAVAGRAQPLLRSLMRHARAVQVASGVLLLAVGVLLVLGLFSALDQYFAALPYSLPL